MGYYWMETVLLTESMASTGQPRYVKLAYLEYMSYVEVIIHSGAFPYSALYFKPVYVELCYHEITAISKWFFIPENKFYPSIPLLVSK